MNFTKTVILKIILAILIFNYILHRYYVNKFKKEHFPPGIIFPLKEDIELPQVETGKNIPKNIYRCYKDKESAKKFQSVFDQTQHYMKGYEQIIYGDEEIDEFIKSNFSHRIYSAYKNINPQYGAARADFFRYLIIYLYGGVYLDIKSGPNKDITKIIEQNKGKLITSYGNGGLPKGIFPLQHLYEWRGGGYYDWSPFTNNSYMEYQQYYIISPKGHPVIKKVIQQVVTNIEEGMKNKNYYSSGHISVVAMTGPITYTMIIDKYKDKYKDVKIFRFPLNGRMNHRLIDYKSIMKNNHYSKINNKNILL